MLNNFTKIGILHTINMINDRIIGRENFMDMTSFNPRQNSSIYPFKFKVAMRINKTIRIGRDRMTSQRYQIISLLVGGGKIILNTKNIPRNKLIPFKNINKRSDYSSNLGSSRASF